MATKLEKQISLEDVKKATMTRGTLYRVLSRGFSLEIDEAYLEWMVLLQPTIKELSLHIDNEDFKKGAERLSAFVDRVKQDYEKDKARFLQDLAVEYASLFLNVGPKPVYLSESVYLGKEHLLYQDPYFDAVRIYQLYDFKKRASFKEPEDHIAIELEFMAHLCDLACLSLDQENKEYAAGYMNNQIEFLDLHLSKWIPLLVEKIRWASKNDFYLALADLMGGFAATDRATAEEFSKDLGGGKNPQS
jgi:putative dimethyl sulfoxide reductase chaperone